MQGYNVFSISLDKCAQCLNMIYGTESPSEPRLCNGLVEIKLSTEAFRYDLGEQLLENGKINRAVVF